MNQYSGPIFGTGLRMPPSNIQAEQALLGAILCNNSAYSRVSEFLLPEHFADPVNGRIYETASRLIEEGRIADAVTLKTHFESAGVLDEVGGTAYLTRLISAMVAIINAGDYGHVILDAWIRRQLIDIGERTVNAAFDGSMPVAENAPLLAAEIDTLTQQRMVRSGVSLAKAMTVALERGRAAFERSKLIANGTIQDLAVRTGIQSLDERFGEWEAAGVYVLAAPSGGGKSALALQIAVYNALRGVPVHYSSTEMQAPQLGRRALSHLTGVPTAVIKAGGWTSAQGTDLGVEVIRVGRFEEYCLIEDSPGLNMRVISAQARAFVRKFPKKQGLIVIDHMHDLGEFSEAELIRAVGAICTALKSLGKQSGWPVLVLAQTTKAAEARENRQPQAGDLYGGKQIEAVAEAILTLHSPEKYLDPFPPQRKPGEGDESFNRRDQAWQSDWDRWRGVVQAFTLKNREGARGVDQLKFDGAKNSFIDAPMPGGF